MTDLRTEIATVAALAATLTRGTKTATAFREEIMALLARNQKAEARTLRRTPERAEAEANNRTITTVLIANDKAFMAEWQVTEDARVASLSDQAKAKEAADTARCRAFGEAEDAQTDLNKANNWRGL